MLDRGDDDGAPIGRLVQHIDPWNSPAVATLIITVEGEHDLKFKRFVDGGVSLKQGNDHVYLTADRYALLKTFM